MRAFSDDAMLRRTPCLAPVLRVPLLSPPTPPAEWIDFGDTDTLAALSALDSIIFLIVHFIFTRRACRICTYVLAVGSEGLSFIIRLGTFRQYSLRYRSISDDR